VAWRRFTCARARRVKRKCICPLPNAHKRAQAHKSPQTFAASLLKREIGATKERPHKICQFTRLFLDTKKPFPFTGRAWSLRLAYFQSRRERAAQAAMNRTPRTASAIILRLLCCLPQLPCIALGLAGCVWLASSFSRILPTEADLTQTNSP